MMWNKTITLYNKSTNPTTGETTWFRHTLKKCFVKHKVGEVNGGAIKTNIAESIIRIPEQRNYLGVFEWLGLPECTKKQSFTLKSGDLIILGNVKDEIDEYTAGQRSSDLIAKYEALGGITVNSVTVNTDLPMPHYLVRGD